MHLDPACISVNSPAVLGRHNSHSIFGIRLCRIVFCRSVISLRLDVLRSDIVVQRFPFPCAKGNEFYT